MSSSLIVLNLRPRPEGEGLQRQLREAGLHSVHIPIFDIEPLSNQQQKDVLSHQKEYSAIIFVSQNAVRYGFAVLNKLETRALSLFAVGPATGGLLTKAARDCSGYLATPVLYPGMSQAHSEGFLELAELDKLQEGDTALIVRGVSGRELIKETLESRGVRVDYLDVYQRQVATQAKIAIPEFWQTYKNCIDSVLVAISSGEALKNLIPLTPEFFYNKCRLLVSSERLAEFARTQGFTRVHCANGATSQQLVSALVNISEVTP